MNKEQTTNREHSDDWRIKFPMYFCGVIGLLLGMELLDSFVGVYLGALSGVYIGVLWQDKYKHTGRDWIVVARKRGLFNPLLVVIVTVSFGWTLSKIFNVKQINPFKTDTIAKIDVYDVFQEEKLKTIDDPEILRAFREGFADVERISSGYRLSDIVEWHIVVYGSKQYNFEIKIHKTEPKRVYGDVIKPNSIMYRHGSFASDKLVPWVIKNLMPENASNEVS